MTAPLTDVHDPYDPNSPAADLHQGSLETCEMLPAIPLIVVDKADMPDNPEDLKARYNGSLAKAATEMLNEDIDRTICLEPVAEQARSDAEGAGYI